MRNAKIIHRGASANHYQNIPIHCCKGVHEYVAASIQSRVPNDARILELGAGSGALTARMRDLAYKNLTPVDLSAEGWQVAECPVKELDLNSPEWPTLLEPTYDLILAVELIEHLNNPTEFLTACASLLKPGGGLIITTPNILSTPSLFSALRHARNIFFDEADFYASGHRSVILPGLLKAMAAEAGLSVHRMECCGELNGIGLLKRGIFKVANVLRSRSSRRFASPILYADFIKP